MPRDRELDRRDAVPALIGDPSDFLIVSGLAGPAKDIGHLTQETPNVYLLGGAMGGAVSMGLGLALAQPERRVLVVTGDGELIMNAGALATVGALQPSNLSIVCVDNGHYGETGNQEGHTSRGVDLEMIARGSAIAVTRTVNKTNEIAEAARILRQTNGPSFVLLRVRQGPPAAYKRNFDAVERKIIFRRNLLGVA